MKVSIITATYNSAKTIGKCMDSVLFQNYDDIEYIVMDGGSTDETIGLVQKKTVNHSQIIFVSEPDEGIYDALNKGIKKATGDIIGFVHSDDYLANKTIIQDIVEQFENHNADGVYGNLHYVAFDNTTKVVRNWKSQAFKQGLLKKGWMPAHPTLYLRKTIYDTYGYFDLSYRIAADYDFILRVFRHKHLNFSYLDKTFVKMRLGGASNRNLKNIITKTKEDYRAVRSNNVGGFLIIVLKNLSKIEQFIFRQKSETVND